MDGDIKPPLGVGPHWFVYKNRIEELNEAIARFLEYINKHQHAITVGRYYEAIEGWAKEIEHLARLEADLYNTRTPKERR